MEQEQERHVERILRCHEFSSELSEAHIAKLASMATTETFHTDERILKAGERADRAYLIREGHVAIEIYHPTRGSVVVQTLGDGKVLGWSWLVKPHRWCFDAMTYSLTRVVVFDALQLREAMRADPEFGFPVLMRFMEVCAERLNHSRLQMIDMFNPV